ncbi:MAG: 23S rRNA (guanosine(2251)-2'-O)-methyltransferase RlmB [Desulfocapsaceae bacterium]|nr:23S rRNA (guanosine(2251)-2'-O)-methyltransferase RlmB [Desulfocapsaceae bacterium]
MKEENKNTKTGRQERQIRFSDDLIWGIHPVMEALQADEQRVSEVILQKDKRGSTWEALLDLVKKRGVRYSFVERVRITGAADTQIRHQGVIARVASVAVTPFDELLEKFSQAVQDGDTPRIIACDSIQDPHNLGAIIRSAHAAGVNSILLPRERSAPLGGTVAKASAGALFLVDICRVTNLSEALKAIKAAGGWIFGAVKDEDAQSIYNTDFVVPACVVVGNEGQGVRPLVRRTCDVLISIPMEGTVDSLNSSVAGAVIMFEMHRQLLASRGTSGIERDSA